MLFSASVFQLNVASHPAGVVALWFLWTAANQSSL